jgi:trimeric autotransporter adhesin
MNKLKLLLLSALALGAYTASAQVKVGDNVTNIDDNAVFEMESTTQGLLLPRMTAAQRDAIATPTNSMLVYNTTEGCINIYNASETRWKSICGEVADGSAEYVTDCASLSVSGTYYTGVELDPDTNYLTVNVDVSELGTYEILVNAAGMYFADSGTFTTTGTQAITLAGTGYPLVAGQNFATFNFGSALCSTVISVQNGVSVISSCGTEGVLTGNIYANTAVDQGTVYKSYTAGPAYTGGTVYGITSAVTNGIKISSPLNGSFTSSGQPIDYIITGTPLIPQSTTLSYSINGFACSFAVPVQSGTGRASAVNCGGALSGTYQLGTAMAGTNTKVVTLTVATVGTFYVRTNTVNGIYFAGSATATATGALAVTLTAVGTPTDVATGTYTISVSSSATAFATCTFAVTIATPSTVPAFNTVTCAALSNSATFIKANNTGASDYFGGYNDTPNQYYAQCTKISKDGLTLAVGATHEDGSLAGGNINSTNNNSLANAGAVYIYTRTSATAAWAFQAKLKPTQLEASDVFGNAVDISADGNTIVVGSMLEDGSGTGVNPAHNNSASASGASYVFVRSGTTWSQQAYLKATAATKTSDQFGASVSISGDGNTVAIGATYEDGGNTGINPAETETKSASGAVYVYKRSGSTWTYNAYIKAHVVDASDWFGNAVALNSDGTTLAVGALYEDGSNVGINPLVNNSATNAGAVYVFTYSGSAWSQQAYIKTSGITASDTFGFSVDLDNTGNKLVVGAPNQDSNGTGVNSAVNTSAANSGAAYVYSRSGATWAPEAMLKASNTSASDSFGCSVSISGDANAVLVGAYREDGSIGCVNGTDNASAADSGAAYSFNLVGASWQPSFKFKMPTVVGLNASDYLGHGVSLDNTGNTIVIAANREDGSGTGINPATNNSAADAGGVVVYTK